MSYRGAKHSVFDYDDCSFKHEFRFQFSYRVSRMVSRQLTADKWLTGLGTKYGEKIRIERTYIGDHTWSFYVEYINSTLVCVTYFDGIVKEIFPMSDLNRS